MGFLHIIKTEQIEKLQAIEFSGSITVVESRNALYDDAISYLGAQQVIGFDTETKPCFIPHVPRNKMAILQLAGHDRAFIFRLQQLGVPKELADILSNQKILKIGAAVRDDIKGLQEYFKFQPLGFVDLQSIAENFGIEEKSVRKMAAIILGRKVSKSQQLSNWESSKLSDAQLRYAAIDAWVCREMYEALKLYKSEHPGAQGNNSGEKK
ncbi:MAG: 3'-5' exonuclease domain-containing protein 2 [Bacteroidales bacterium]|jgi:ribonuclease D|nr:3'-5' exonuclease domain-containing protein 2 [Bacteroidales bacterium]MCI1733368.1 3'-5' exonuclease domain-containing protein 2 [Bacteroidales bacterium]